jgi:hypothetical protein
MNEAGKNVLKDLPPFKLPPLPYTQDALQPVIHQAQSRFTISNTIRNIYYHKRIISGTASKVHA